MIMLKRDTGGAWHAGFRPVTPRFHMMGRPPGRRERRVWRRAPPSARQGAGPCAPRRRPSSEVAPVYQLTVLYNHPEDAAAFDKHYDEVHAPLANTLPGIRRYTVS